MSRATIYHVGDSAPNIPITVRYRNGGLVPLVSGDTVNFYITNSAGTVINTGRTGCTIGSYTLSQAVYDVDAADFPAVGTYYGLTKVTDTNGEIKSERKTHKFLVKAQYSD